jgi:phosphohistidine phosphatase SixA
MELHLLRHADAGDPAAWDGPDELRPLSAKGGGQADRLGAHLARIGYRLDVVVTSTKLRAAQTAERCASPLKLEVVADERLAGGLGLSELTAILDDLGRPERPVLVGHDPDFSSLLGLLTGANTAMAKGALARIALRLPAEPGAAALDFLLPPRLLPR